ncbi:MAG: DUF4838 domain-containing protein [Armatimonadota bacterium]
MNTVICISDPHPVIRFAARELARYLRKATGEPVLIVKKPGAGSAVLRLGLLDAVADDDRILIEPEGDGYRLSGANPRSVLFAAYRYLQELGFRWIRPGARGEIIPQLENPIQPGIAVDETPSYKYRTICIEGAASQHHVVDLIDWMAKQGMNGYFVQFDLARGSAFWDRWYEHHDNPYLPHEPLDLKKIEQAVVAAMEKRGLRFESMGHGWIDAVLHDEKLSPDAKQLAVLDNKREPGGHLCYSTPAVRQAMIEKIVDYARTHPNVTELHIWLADGSNNNCECEGCRDTQPADWYVLLLNEVDAALTAAGLATKLVFLIYVDLLWPPVEQRLNNPERFVLMFAPITRTYRESLVDAQINEPMKPFQRNKLDFPQSAGGNLAYLQAWQRLFHGEGFDFDYHLIWAPYRDLAQFTLARVLHKDIRGLARFGLHGFNSCQNMRQSFPHNLGMDVMARTLWDKRVPFSRIVAETFTDAYGPDGPAVARFFERMSALTEPFFERVHSTSPDTAWVAEGLDNLPKMRALVRRFRKVVRNHRAEAGAVKWSWRYLGIYLDLMDLWIPAVEAFLRRDPDCRTKYEALFEYLRKKEALIHPDLDVFAFIKVAKWYIYEAEKGLQRDPTADGIY